MSISDFIKSAYDIAKKINNLALQKELIDMNEKYQQLQDENLKLKKENTELKSKLDIGMSKRMKTDPIDGFIYEHLESGRNGPFCPTCWHNVHEPIELVKTSTPNIYYCGKCDKYRYPANYQEPRDKDIEDFFNFKG